MFLRSFLPLFLFLLVFTTGCGGGSDSGGEISAAPQPVYGNATLRISQQVRAQLVPDRVDTVRITGFQSGIVGGVYDARAGGIPFPARELPLAPVYTLENVPTNVDNIMLEYLDGSQVIGMYFQEVKLVDGQVYEIVDPAIATRPTELTAFSVFVGWTPPGEIWKYGIGQHWEIWTEVFAVPNFNPRDHLPTLPHEGEEGFEVWDALKRFTVWEISDPTIATVFNGSSFNSTYRAGNVKGLRPGIVTLTGRFFDITASTQIEFVDPPVADDYMTLGLLLDENDSDRVLAIGSFNDYQQPPNMWERNVTSEVTFRPSDDPAVADWDTTPGREGYLIRGEKIGRVALWARHPRTLNWSFILIENAAPE